MKLIVLVLVLVLVGCGGAADPCDGVAGRCIALHVESTTVARIDQLELDVVYGDLHGTVTTGSGAVDLPLATAIELASTSETLAVGVVAAGKLGGNVLGAGAAQTSLPANAHVELSLELAAPPTCQAGAYYCGGDKLPGDPGVLYQCNGGGVPLARGRCANGCLVRPTQDDLCDAGPATCIDGGFYCGGDKVLGDPQSLYTCSAGAGTARMVCANGCVIEPSPNDDHCR